MLKSTSFDIVARTTFEPRQFHLLEHPSTSMSARAHRSTHNLRSDRIGQRTRSCKATQGTMHARHGAIVEKLRPFQRSFRSDAAKLTIDPATLLLKGHVPGQGMSFMPSQPCFNRERSALPLSFPSDLQLISVGGTAIPPRTMEGQRSHPYVTCMQETLSVRAAPRFDIDCLWSLTHALNHPSSARSKLQGDETAN